MSFLVSPTPLNKAKAAFLHSCNTLFHWPGTDRRRRVYMWTFTFEKVVEDSIAFESWNHLVTLFRRRYRDDPAHGIRNVEVHPGGHGLHFHALIAKRLDVNEVRKMAIRAGFGRIHVQKCKESAAVYCAKYLTKKDDGLKKGCRRWGFMGGFKGTRVKDIEVESDLADNCRKVASMLKGKGRWSASLFVEINKLTARHGHWRDWPSYPALLQKPEYLQSDNDFPVHAVVGRRVPCFDQIKVFTRELGEYVTHLIPVRCEQPF